MSRRHSHQVYLDRLDLIVESAGFNETAQEDVFVSWLARDRIWPTAQWRRMFEDEVVGGI
jgi:hypothetical protein